jgi:hypothetical protein
LRGDIAEGVEMLGLDLDFGSHDDAHNTSVLRSRAIEHRSDPVS